VLEIGSGLGRHHRRVAGRAFGDGEQTQFAQALEHGDRPAGPQGAADKGDLQRARIEPVAAFEQAGAVEARRELIQLLDSLGAAQQLSGATEQLFLMGELGKGTRRLEPLQDGLEVLGKTRGIVHGVSVGQGHLR